ncbi:MAG: hypothetical protein ACRER2_05295 [Methylococcales bacterium]
MNSLEHVPSPGLHRARLGVVSPARNQAMATRLALLTTPISGNVPSTGLGSDWTEQSRDVIQMGLVALDHRAVHSVSLEKFPAKKILHLRARTYRVRAVLSVTFLVYRR